MDKDSKTYENLIKDQYENDSYFDINPEILNRYLIDHILNGKATIELLPLLKVRIENIFSAKKEIIEALPRIIEDAFLTGIRLSKLNDIEGIKDKLFIDSKNKLSILKHEYNRFSTKITEITEIDNLLIVDEISIKNTIYQAILNLDKLENLPALEYLNELIIQIIQARTTLEWIEENINETDLEVKSEIKTDKLKSQDTHKRIIEILEEVRSAFEDKNHIDTIAAGLIEYYDTGKCQDTDSDRQTVIMNTIDFYKVFAKISNDIDLKPKKIGEVLTRFIYQHNGSGDCIHPNTIRKWIYECSKLLTDSNRP